MNLRPRSERLCLLGSALSPQFPAHDVRIGAAIVDQMPSEVGDVGEEPGDEVEGDTLRKGRDPGGQRHGLHPPCPTTVSRGHGFLARGAACLGSRRVEPLGTGREGGTYVDRGWFTDCCWKQTINVCQKSGQGDTEIRDGDRAFCR